MAIIDFNPNNKPINKAGQTISRTDKNSEKTNNDSHHTAPTDSVNLTESAKLIQHLEEQLRLLPIVDADKVSLVKENLNNGNYQISSQNIANKFSQYEIFLQNVG